MGFLKEAGTVADTFCMSTKKPQPTPPRAPEPEPTPEQEAAAAASSQAVRNLVARSTTLVALGIVSAAIIGTAAVRIGAVMEVLVASLP